MKPEELDRLLIQEMGELPPDPGSLEGYAPWRQAMDKVLLGLALTTFLFEFFYLNYLLPLLGGVLLYLGFRSLRRENRRFALCWALSGVRLGWQIVFTVLGATPLLERLTASAANYPLSTLINAVNVALLFSLRGGVRLAFAAAGEERPKDWLGRGLAAYLASLALALWSELVPLTEPGLFGQGIMREWQWLYYGRGIAFTVLQIYLLACIARQSDALAGRGYDIKPIPVRFSGRTVLLIVFAAVLLSLPLALWLGGQVSNGPESRPQALTAEQTAARDRLEELGMPEYLSRCLDGGELDLCAQALAVKPADHTDTAGENGEHLPCPGGLCPAALKNCQAWMSVWAVELPGGLMRYYCCFRYDSLPALRLQEQFSLDPSRNTPIDDFSARLTWKQDGQTFTAQPQVRLAGGQTADNLDEDFWAGMFPDSAQIELDRLGGHLQYRPWFNFSIPRGAEELTGYLAYTANPRPSGGGESTYDSVYAFLRHQFRLLHYPFASISHLGGAQHGGSYGPIISGWGMFGFYY